MSSSFPDDTELDAIAAQVRSTAPLESGAVADLLEVARDAPGTAATGRLVEQQLGIVLDSVLARRDAGVGLMDLYQDGSVAATVAVREYATRGGRADGLGPYVRRVVETFLDEAVNRDAAQRLADTLLIERVKLLETADLALRRRLDREPTEIELAAALAWTPDEVDAVQATLLQAREVHDAEMVAFLDDVDEGDAGGTADI